MRLRSGTVLQSGIPVRFQSQKSFGANGLLLRGVVIATYELDNGSHPHLENDPVAIYCDVLVYSDLPGMRSLILKEVLVKQDRGGIHSGRVWKPRATRIDTVEAATITQDGIAGIGNPAAFDGDHVLIGFIDNAMNKPIILGGIPHPTADKGNESKDAGHRRRLVLADGDPDFWKHKGAFYGIDKDGNFTVDTTEAYAVEDFETDGREPAPPNDGSTGNYNVRLPAGSKLHVEIDGTTHTFEFAETFMELKLDGGATFKFELKDANAKLTLGDGSKHAAIYEALETFWNSTVKPKFDAFDAHIHPTGVGPSGPPTPLVTFPTLATSIKSTKVNIPDA